MRIARVFPRRTKQTPSDEMVFVGDPPFWHIECVQVFVSCTFTWDLPEANRLAASWAAKGYRVSLGGPALGDPGGEFVPGRFLAKGITITSRGCVRRCPWCLAWRREGNIRTLPIRAGHIVQDNNLLACPRSHIEAVLEMLAEQKEPATFSGGLDARLLEPWFARRLSEMRIKQIFTAFDAPGHETVMRRAIGLLLEHGLSRRKVRCFVLVGFDGDTQSKALSRLEAVWEAGGLPFAMFYRDAHDARPRVPEAWRRLVREWTRPAAMFAEHALEGNEP